MDWLKVRRLCAAGDEPAHLVNFRMPDAAPTPAAIAIFPPSFNDRLEFACEKDISSNSIFSPTIDAYSVNAPNSAPGMPCLPFGSIYLIGF